MNEPSTGRSQPDRDGTRGQRPRALKRRGGSFAAGVVLILSVAAPTPLHALLAPGAAHTDEASAAPTPLDAMKAAEFKALVEEHSIEVPSGEAKPKTTKKSGGKKGKKGKASDTFRVQVGAPSPRDTPLEFTRFYPDRLQVRRGQTVQFDTINFHTVAFRPGGEDGRLPLVRRDEGPGGFALTEDAWERSECGGPDQAACVLDGPDDELSSGIPVWDLTWRVQIDRPVGTTITYVCMFHPGMNATIEVVDDTEPLPTQEEIDAEVRSQVALDTQEAIDHVAMLERDVAHREEGGRTVWTVLVGPATPSGNAGILGYVPKRLEGLGPETRWSSSRRVHPDITP